MHSDEPKAASGTDPTLSRQESSQWICGLIKWGWEDMAISKQEERGFWWLCHLPVNVLQAIQGKKVHIVHWSWEKLIFRLWGNWSGDLSGVVRTLLSVCEWIIRNILTFCPCNPIHFSLFLNSDSVLWCIHSEGSRGGLGIVSGSFPPSLTSMGALNRNVAYFAEAHEMSVLQCCHS